MQGMDATGQALVDEAMKKAAVAWLAVPGGSRAYVIVSIEYPRDSP